MFLQYSLSVASFYLPPSLVRFPHKYHPSAPPQAEASAWVGVSFFFFFYRGYHIFFSLAVLPGPIVLFFSVLYLAEEMITFFSRLFIGEVFLPLVGRIEAGILISVGLFFSHPLIRS